MSLISKLKDIQQQLMLNNKNQIYIAPNKALRGYVAKYTLSFASNASVPDMMTLIPDASGCLIFTFDGSSVTSLLWGTTTKTFNVKNDMYYYPIQLYIELLPGGLFYLTGIKQAELTNLQMPLQQINNTLHFLISNAFDNAETLNCFISNINSILLSYFQNRTLPQTLFSALENVKRYNGCLSVRELAKMEFYSERHLNRLFNDYVGTNIKTFSSIVRINHVLQEMSSGRRLTADTAQTSGFYDQAHFIRTFKTICGETPKKYFENMSDLYNESYKKIYII